MAARDVADPYLDPSSGVLRNKLGITDDRTLQVAERDFARVRIAELAEKPVAGRFDLAHLKAIHGHIFGDVYPWAGEARTVDIAKGQTLFAPVRFMEGYAEKVFGKLAGENQLKDLSEERFVERAAYYYAEINSTHLFREGNGRAQRVFLEQLGREAGHVLDFSRIPSEQLVRASEAAHNRGAVHAQPLIETALRDGRRLEEERSAPGPSQQQAALARPPADGRTRDEAGVREAIAQANRTGATAHARAAGAAWVSALAARGELESDRMHGTVPQLGALAMPTGTEAFVAGARDALGRHLGDGPEGARRRDAAGIALQAAATAAARAEVFERLPREQALAARPELRDAFQLQEGALEAARTLIPPSAEIARSLETRVSASVAHLVRHGRDLQGRSEALVEATRVELSRRALAFAEQDRLIHPERAANVTLEQREVLVRESERALREVEGPAYRAAGAYASPRAFEAFATAHSLARLDHPNNASTFGHPELKRVYATEQTFQKWREQQATEQQSSARVLGPQLEASR